MKLINLMPYTTGAVITLALAALISCATDYVKHGMGGDGRTLRGTCGFVNCSAWIEECAQHRTLRDCRQDALGLGCRP